MTEFSFKNFRISVNERGGMLILKKASSQVFNSLPQILHLMVISITPLS